jgi:2OG-Fe(II) oxygenase superfamily
VKAQLNTGQGGCFPLHVDSDPSVDRRVVTAILYLNSGWESARDGGSLRLAPFPMTGGNGSRFTDISPMEGRLVLMSANEMHHRVLPTFAHRYCATLWLFGTVSSRVWKPQPLDASCTNLSKIFSSLRYRKHVARVALSEDWEESLRDAHGSGDSEVAVEAQRREVEKICAILADDISSRFLAFSAEEVRRVLGDPENVHESIRTGSEEELVIQWFA